MEMTDRYEKRCGSRLRRNLAAFILAFVPLSLLTSCGGGESGGNEGGGEKEAGEQANKGKAGGAD